ncbi:dihydrofolate reductase [Conchiformibius steedae DSM 2580]|uniref:Dihydrofolate reductase n=1 Tax=Conchiformibius steedae DSM 2580 TaxID=1121352 RepID=A0AAE9HVY0_9NEIS|nr:dihydrofolate reductase [Conchiformibius steedae]QMT34448.1 dihydrofolate reductase [Conchiformibius steedae]URD67230.1 dihydrofolate reductase [Conchiformibius steedae DSM 2580]
MQRITLIAAADINGCIGGNNTMLWHIPEDFAFFKQYTLGKPVIMGRKTWQSLPKRPLPERRNIVLSRQRDWTDTGAEVFADLNTALAACADAPEVMIIGGAQLYAQVLPLATDLRLTEVRLNVAGDAFFPEFSRQQWQEVSRESHVSARGIGFDLVHWQRFKYSG